MAEAAPQLPDAVLERIDARVRAQYTAYKETSTEAHKAAAAEALTKYTTDPEFKNTHMAKMTASWTAADADGDGRLNLAEYKVWEA